MDDWTEDFETLTAGELVTISVMYDYDNREHAAHQSTFFQEEYQKPNTDWWYASDNCLKQDFAGHWDAVQAWAVSPERSFEKDAWAILDALDLRTDYYVILVADGETVEGIEWDQDGDGFVKKGLVAVARRDGTFSEEEHRLIDERVRSIAAYQATEAA